MRKSKPKCKCGENRIKMFYKSNKSKCKTCISISYKLHEKNNLLQIRWLGAKHRAIKKGLEFTITLNDLEGLLESQNNKCHYTGLEFINDNSKSTSVSIDRIDSSKGYIPSNIRLVCTTVNIMKSDRTEEEFLQFIKHVNNHMNL